MNIVTSRVSKRYIKRMSKNALPRATKHIGRAGSRKEEWIYILPIKDTELKELSYVHGSFAGLLSGKECVVRDSWNEYRKIASSFLLETSIGGEEVEVNNSAFEWVGVPKSVKTEKGYITILGITKNGNTKIRLNA